MRLRAAACALCCAACPALAQDFIDTGSGLLSDSDFYRLVSCGAPPWGDCAKPVVKWPVTAPVSVGLVHVDRALMGGKQARARAAITRAVQYLNDTGMGLRLTEAGDPNIRIYLIDTDGSAPIGDIGFPEIEGQTVRGARVLVRARDTMIERAEIIIGTRLSIRQYESAMLEEITQALGLLTDIRNPSYDGVSIFSEDSNASKTLGPQDIMALRRHYPPSEDS